MSVLCKVLNTLLEIRLTQFRNYGNAHFIFPETITCITGPNGSGKTSLLDAVYYLCYSKSYFSVQQQHSVQSGTEGFRVEGQFEPSNQPVTIVCKWREGKKELSADGIIYDRVTEHIGRFAAVMIAPDDMVMIHEGSEGRRRWMDSILGQTDRKYLEDLMTYQRVLLQRNAWMKLQSLRPSETRTELQYYDQELSRTGQYIHQKRTHFLEDFKPLLTDCYDQLSNRNEKVSIEYLSDQNHTTLATSLLQSFEQDLRFQRTTKGIHRDDLVFLIQDKPLKQYGSQGQKKSFLFALKLAQYQYLASHQGRKPILLLDDVFEKLDQQRMESLLRIIQGTGFGQVILTDTHPERVRMAFSSGTQMGEIHL